MIRIYQWTLLSFCFLFLMNCGAKYQPVKAPEVVDDQKMMLGEVVYDDILHFFPKWNEEDKTVSVSQEQIAGIQAIDRKVEIVCYFGSWCGDSRRGVPPFYRVLQQAAKSNIKLQLIGVNRDKVDPEFKALDLGIERVPTFIILENDQEIGRFIEFPQKDNFAADLLTLL